MVASLKKIGGGGKSALTGAAASKYYDTILKEMEQDRRTAAREAGKSGTAEATEGYQMADPSAPLARWFSLTGQLAADNAPIHPGQLTNLLDGRSLDGSASLVQQQAGRSRVHGWDMTFSAPKSVSAIWATSDAAERQRIMEDIAESARAALKSLADRGVFVTRTGAGSTVREQAADVAVALFPQNTARSGDPQLHCHSVIGNVCVRADGSTGTLDSPGLYAWKTYAGAVFRAELAARTQARIGAALEEDGRSFKVAGVPDNLVATWSKRRKVILTEFDRVKAALEKGANAADAEARTPDTDGALRGEVDATTAQPIKGKGQRELKDRITKQTRATKSKVPGITDLEKRWLAELAACGHSREDVLRLVQEAAAKKVAEEQAPRKSAAEAAIDAALSRNAVVTERMLRRLVAEEAQVRGIGAAGAHAEFDQAVASGKLILLPGKTQAGEAVWTTRQVLDRERCMILDAAERRGERDRNRGRGSYIEEAAAERVIAAIAARAAAEPDPKKRRNLSEQQAAAVRRAANGDGVVVIEGAAGAGKSFTTGAIKEAAEASGLTCIGIAPSWKAADIIRRDAQLESARALQGFVLGLESGRIRFGNPPPGGGDRGVRYLGERVALLLDEAGMASSSDLAALLRHARQHRVTVILAGDRKQLKSVEPGAAFAAVADTIGVARMDEIRRQSEEWMRKASYQFALGNSVEGLARYDAKGHIAFAADRFDAMKRLADDYMASLQAHPDRSRIVLASRNADVHQLNRTLRERLMESGALGPDTITLRTQHSGGRDGSGEARDMEVRAGDRVMIGLTVGPEEARKAVNGDVATVVGFEPGADPQLRLRLDRTGQELFFRLSELTPPRREGQGDEQNQAPLLPVLQHAYALSVHKSQGQTVGQTFVYAGDGMSADLAYVAFTRHVEDVRGYVDSAAIAERLAENGEQATEDAIRKAFLSAAKLSSDGLNASDYVQDKKAWLHSGDPFATSADGREVPTTAESRMQMAAEGTQDAVLASLGRKAADLGEKEIRVSNRELLDQLRERQGVTVRMPDGSQERRLYDRDVAAMDRAAKAAAKRAGFVGKVLGASYSHIPTQAQAAQRQARMVAVVTTMQSLRDKLAPARGQMPGDLIRRAFERDAKRQIAAHAVRVAAHERRISETVDRLRRPGIVARAEWWLRKEVLRSRHKGRRQEIASAHSPPTRDARMAVFNVTAAADWKGFAERRRAAFERASASGRSKVPDVIAQLRREAPQLTLPSEREWILHQAQNKEWLRRLGAADAKEAIAMAEAAKRGETYTRSDAAKNDAVRRTEEARRDERPIVVQPPVAAWGAAERVETYLARLAAEVKTADGEAGRMLASEGRQGADWLAIRENAIAGKGALAELARRSRGAEDVILEVRRAVDTGRLSLADEIRAAPPGNRAEAKRALLEALEDRVPAGLTVEQRAQHLAERAGLDGSQRKAGDVLAAIERVRDRLAGSPEAAAAAPAGSPARSYAEAAQAIRQGMAEQAITPETLMAAARATESRAFGQAVEQAREAAQTPVLKMPRSRGNTL
ncbi:MobF family relaxase [Belnapia rosea]|uniref:Conjugative relaxase domain-containing protein, TrwC/TraI family n=1 Tax=Belnapia rosea TaxID=938405 RepID=A0A1G7BTG4_9PROT|nr:MobF family relaxase [Belnapia rosea]SDE30252.1 conjugative relaxase domain-containing protein, TrwC/TraI family [Belnapia rosea]